MKDLLPVGERVKVGCRGSVQTYPYVETSPTGPSRTRMETHAYAITAVSTSVAVSEMTFALLTLMCVYNVNAYRFTG